MEIEPFVDAAKAAQFLNLRPRRILDLARKRIIPAYSVGSGKRNGNDPKLVQELLRHSNVKTTLDVYARAMTPAKIEAQGWVLRQLLTTDVKSVVM